MADSLICGAVAMLGPRDLADSICGTAQSFDDFCGALEKRSLRAALKARASDTSVPINAWSLPDAVWVSVSRKQPRLAQYPLGDVAQRALKKTIVDFLARSDGTGPAGLAGIADENLIEVFLRSSLEAMNRAKRLGLLLSHYFFEIAVDYLRRPSEQEDWNHGYHFSKSGKAVSTKSEHRFRQKLAAQCTESAERFRPFLLKAVANPGPQAEGNIADGLATVFGAQAGKTNDPPAKKGKPFANVIVGSRSRAELRRSFTLPDDGPMRVLLEGEHRNVTCTFSAIEDFLGRPLHSLTKDLVEIGAAIYMADIHCRRASNLKRRIGLVMPVRHRDVWSRAAPLVERAVAELGGDDFAIHFQKKNQRAERITPFEANPDNRRVCLFSGGMDSLAGVVWALEKRLEPTLVSHFANPKLSGIQNSLSAAIAAAKGRQPLANVHVRVNRKAGKQGPPALPPKPKSPMAEFLRSFLFLSIACAVAVESGIGTVYVFENGPVALNPLLSEGTVATRTAHPHFLAAFRELVRLVFGGDLRIENPFQYKTKGEVAKILDRPRLRGLVKRSNSCWNWFKVQVIAQQMGVMHFKGSHDGFCLPCILRRTSMDAAGLWSQDAHYLVDVFACSPKKTRRETLVAIADLLRFCKNVTTLGEGELLSFAPDLSVYDEHSDAGSLVEMVRRHAHEVIECFRTHSNRQLKRTLEALL